MATRSHIVVRNPKEEPQKWKYIYHHWDGYPDGVGKELRNQFTGVIPSKGPDEKYTKEKVIDIITDIEDDYRQDSGIHGDEEYVYVFTVEPDKKGVSVDCYSTCPFDFDTNPKDFSEDEGYTIEYHEIYRYDTLDPKTEINTVTDDTGLKNLLPKMTDYELLSLSNEINYELMMRDVKRNGNNKDDE